VVGRQTEGRPAAPSLGVVLKEIEYLQYSSSTLPFINFHCPPNKWPNQMMYGHTLSYIVRHFRRLGCEVCTVCGADTSIHQWESM